MTKVQASPECPLCHVSVSFLTRRIDAKPLRAYWREIGYDVDAHHRAFPAAFDVWTCAVCGLGTFHPRILGPGEMYAVLGKHDFYYDLGRWDHLLAAGVLHGLSAANVLEFGCGDGRFLDRLRTFIPSTVGLDFNAEGIAAARARGHDAYLSWQADWNGKFDAVVTLQTLEHVPDPGDAVQRLVQAVRPGGYLVVAVPNDDGPLRQLAVNPLNAPPHHASLWPRQSFDYIAAKHGLELVRYATEPMSRMLYRTLVDDSISQTFAGRRSRLVLRFWRPIVDALAAMAEIGPEVQAGMGHNHLAVFKKPQA